MTSEEQASITREIEALDELQMQSAAVVHRARFAIRRMAERLTSADAEIAELRARIATLEATDDEVA